MRNSIDITVLVDIYKNGRSYQGVLLKLCFWCTRDMIYQSRKKFGFKVSAGLTPRRMDILVFAQNQIEKTGDVAIERVVDYIKCEIFRTEKISDELISAEKNSDRFFENVRRFFCPKIFPSENFSVRRFFCPKMFPFPEFNNFYKTI